MIRLFMFYQFAFILPFIALIGVVHMMIPEAYHLFSDTVVYLFATVLACHLHQAPQPRKYILVASMIYFIGSLALAHGFMAADILMTLVFQYFVMQLAKHTHEWRTLGQKIAPSKPQAYFNA